MRLCWNQQKRKRGTPVKQARKKVQILHRARPAGTHADERSTRTDNEEDNTMKNNAEFDAYKDFICKMLDRCDLRRVKIIYEFVLAIID